MFPELTRDDVFRIETKRLWLRWARMTDTADILYVMGEKQVAEMTATWTHPLDEHEINRRIFEMRKFNALGNGLQLVMALKSDPDAIIGLVGGTFTGQTFDIGYALHPEFQGFGYATEAVQALMDAVFTLSDASRAHAIVRGSSERAHRVLIKSGFEFSSVSNRYSLTRREWNAIKDWSEPMVEPLLIDVGIDALEEENMIEACVLMNSQVRGVEVRI